jgi:glycosyltransferase involved in cell wall biosynthesis
MQRPSAQAAGHQFRNNNLYLVRFGESASAASFRCVKHKLSSGERMNLVFAGSSPRAWGSEQHFICLAQSCREAGHRVVAIVRADSEVADLMRLAGIEVRAAPFRGGADPRAMLAVFKAIRELRAEWIVTPHQKHFWPLYILARLAGAKIAVFRHLVFIRSRMTRVVFPRLADRFFVVSDFALEELVRAGAPRHRLTRLYNPIDLRRFRPNAAMRERMRAELNVPQDAILIGFVGRHESSKGVRVLRDALHQAMNVSPKIYALWIGGGPEWLETRAAICASQHEHRHRFIEWTRSPEDYYVAMDCMVAPSLAPETFGRVVAEAQACEVPVIASRAGGLGEAFVPNLTGEHFPGDDPTALAAKILGLAGDKDLRVEMGREGRRFVERFDSGRIAGAFVNDLTFRRVVAAKKQFDDNEPKGAFDPEAPTGDTDAPLEKT